MIRRMMPPNNESIQHIAQTGGVNEQTLHNWRKAARADRQVALGHGDFSEQWSTEDKFLIVVETAAMNEPEQHHSDQRQTILDKRHHAYKADKATHPECWNGCSTRNWSLLDVMYLTRRMQTSALLMRSTWLPHDNKIFQKALDIPLNL